jgi:hypothetical protein
MQGGVSSPPKESPGPVFASLDHPLFASEKRVKKELTENLAAQHGGI